MTTSQRRWPKQSTMKDALRTCRSSPMPSKRRVARTILFCNIAANQAFMCAAAGCSTWYSARSEGPNPSTVRRHPHLLTHFQERTGRTLRRHARADVLTERHQQLVDLDPVAARQLGDQG